MLVANGLSVTPFMQLVAGTPSTVSCPVGWMPNATVPFVTTTPAPPPTWQDAIGEIATTMSTARLGRTRPNDQRAITGPAAPAYKCFARRIAAISRRSLASGDGKDHKRRDQDDDRDQARRDAAWGRRSHA